MDGEFDRNAMLAALAWQVDLGAVDAIGAAPVNRFEVKPEPKAGAAAPAPPASAPAALATSGVDAVAEARAAAAAAASLAALAAAQEGFAHCELKRGARSFVFADGRPGARVMVIGEGPGAEEDRQGRPFAGPAGQLLDRMFAAIGLARDAAEAGAALYLSEVIPWRAPQNRDPKPEELAMMRPFVERHIALAAPELLVLMGNPACAGLLGRAGITRLRGKWHEVAGVPAIPMFHPARLMKQPELKRPAWADLLMVKARLEGMR